MTHDYGMTRSSPCYLTDFILLSWGHVIALLGFPGCLDHLSLPFADQGLEKVLGVVIEMLMQECARALSGGDSFRQLGRRQ